MINKNIYDFLAKWKDTKKKELMKKKSLREIGSLLQNNQEIKLEFGSTNRRDGWLTVDLDHKADIQWDFTDPLPFPKNSVNQIYSSHLLEHFYYTQLIEHLSEIKSILRPGGIFKTAVPNARIYINGYLNPGEFDVKKFCRWQPAFHYHSPIDYLNFIAYLGGQGTTDFHHHLFDEENLLAILNYVGFTNVKVRKFDPSVDLEKRKDESIFATCEKPA